MPGVGTTKIFENDKIILWEFVLEPGERTPVHTHHHDYVFYVLEGSTLEVFDTNGAALGGFEARTGDTFPLRCEGGMLISSDDKGLRAPATHSARNAGASRYREILVETKP
jgi:hypothetical protein